MERTAYYEEGDPEYDPDHRNYEVVKGMNYEQWTNYKQDQIRQRYGGEAKVPMPEIKPKVDEERIVVSTEEELEAMRQKQKEYDEKLEKVREEGADLYHEKSTVNNELRKLREMESKLDNPDLQMLDHLKSEEELKKYREELSQQCKELQDARAALKRPGRPDDYATMHTRNFVLRMTTAGATLKTTGKLKLWAVMHCMKNRQNWSTGETNWKRRSKKMTKRPIKSLEKRTLIMRPSSLTR